MTQNNISVSVKDVLQLISDNNNKLQITNEPHTDDDNYKLNQFTFSTWIHPDTSAENVALIYAHLKDNQLMQIGVDTQGKIFLNATTDAIWNTSVDIQETTIIFSGVTTYDNVQASTLIYFNEQTEEKIRSDLINYALTQSSSTSHVLNALRANKTFTHTITNAAYADVSYEYTFFPQLHAYTMSWTNIDNIDIDVGYTYETTKLINIDGIDSLYTVDESGSIINIPGKKTYVLQDINVNTQVVGTEYVFEFGWIGEPISVSGDMGGFVIGTTSVRTTDRYTKDKIYVDFYKLESNIHHRTRSQNCIFNPDFTHHIKNNTYTTTVDNKFPRFIKLIVVAGGLYNDIKFEAYLDEERTQLAYTIMQMSTGDQSVPLDSFDNKIAIFNYGDPRSGLIFGNFKKQGINIGEMGINMEYKAVSPVARITNIKHDVITLDESGYIVKLDDIIRNNDQITFIYRVASTHVLQRQYIGVFLSEYAQVLTDLEMLDVLINTYIGNTSEISQVEPGMYSTSYTFKTAIVSSYTEEAISNQSVYVVKVFLTDQMRNIIKTTSSLVELQM
jgi:hypothetical protein